ncbi:MAG: phosphoribosylaminoimidazolesuccinocarboxamide synthase [Methanomicrobiaceae archaeon]|nr:phosphoribosylaminoimidazolesuccinocarboxamide synthase [Methanomicrobiaceae archaeon]
MTEMLYQGKAKSVYRSETPGALIMVFRDDVTAFDGEKKDVMQGKGRYNQEVSAFFFTYLEKRGVPTHYRMTLDPVTMLVDELEMIPIEVIVRNVAAGSITRRYPFTRGQRLDPPVVMMDYKNDALHDPMLNDDLILALGLLSSVELRQVREIALEVNRLLSTYFEEKGIMLADFKVEFGRRNGEIVLADEISMDSMRLWDRQTGESLDKDVYRFGTGDLLSAYARVAERILEREGDRI